ncbi:MAG: peptidylprolyl isomerase [Lachnospiraceae bacterium]|nr:peptidylprolyl isomerase [Lachnospiraceae bacterium]
MHRKIMFLLVCLLALSGCGKKTAGTTEEDKNASGENPALWEYYADEIEGNEELKSLPQLSLPNEGDEIAVIKTDMGEMTFKLFPEYAPKAVENFVTHAKEGYYDGLKFHRVIDDFMIQSGDPTGTGKGGESIWGEAFEDEVSPKLHQFRGVLSMANSGTDTNGSQFFIVDRKTTDTDYLDAIKDAINKDGNVAFTLPDGKSVLLKDMFTDSVLNIYEEYGGTIHLDNVFGKTHTVFGQCIYGMDVLEKISSVETDSDDVPTEDVIINTIEITTFKAK